MNRDKIVSEYLLNNTNSLNYYINNNLQNITKKARIDILPEENNDLFERSVEIFHDKKDIKSFESRRKKSLKKFEEYIDIKYTCEPEY